MNRNRHFFVTFVLPSVAVIILYCILIFVFFIPSEYDELITLKKNSLKELMDATESIISHYHTQEQLGVIDQSEARSRAAQAIENIRYGKDKKDYFWINDTHPRMVMHPYRKDLEGTDLSTFTDKKNSRIFVRFVENVKMHGEGFQYYYWQWMDNSKKITPKLSYVRGFKPWGWVIGTGVYIEDIRKEITSIIQFNIFMTIIIALVITSILYHNVKLTHKLDNLRDSAEKKLAHSRDRYKALVNASGEGIVFISNGKINYANRFFLDLCGYVWKEIENCESEILFSDYARIADFSVHATIDPMFESTLKCKNGSQIPVVCSLSSFEGNEQSGVICSVKDVSPESFHSTETIKNALIADFHKDYSFLFRRVTDYIKPVTCLISHSPLQKAISTLADEDKNSVVIVSEQQEILGIITSRDLRTRISNNFDINNVSVSRIMTSPVKYISSKCQIFEAVSMMQQNNISHLVVTDSELYPVGILNSTDILYSQAFLTSTILESIKNASDVLQLQDNFRKIKLVTGTLISSGASIHNLQSAFVSINRHLFKKAWNIACRECRIPETPYALLLTGSLGRGEQTFNSDYDNILIFSDSSDNESVRQSFLKTAGYASDILEQVGIPGCEGGVTSSNAAFCKSVKEWEKVITSTISTPTPESFLTISELLDIDCTEGNTALSEDFTKYIVESLNSSPQCIAMYARNVLQKKIPIDFLGNIQKKGESADQKFNVKEALLPLVNAVRFYSLVHALKVKHTTERLKALHEKNVIVDKDLETLLDAFTFLQNLLIKTQLTSPSEANTLRYDELSEMDRIHLKRSVSRIQVFISRIGFDYNIT